MQHIVFPNVLNQKSSDIVPFNSSDTLLTNGQTYTGLWYDTIGYNTVTVACKTDKSGLLYVDFSPDASNADSSLSYTVQAATNEVHRLTITRRYFRVRFTNNSGSNQTYFRLQSLIGNHPNLTSNLNSTITDDADASTSRSVLYGRLPNGSYKAVNVSALGNLEQEIRGPRLPFGSIHVESLNPVFQSDAVYGLNSNQEITKSTLSGSVTAQNNLFDVSTGTTVDAQASLQSRKRLRYRPGQGTIIRYTALFTNPVASSYQVAGVGHAEDSLCFAYKDLNFGILRSYNGVREIQTLTITTASTTNENVTITLNGVAFSVAVTNSGNIQRTTYELSLGTYAGWAASSNGSTVVFLSDSAGNKSGTFLTTATTMVGTFAETKAGSNTTEDFYPQTEWTGDVCDGSGSDSNASGFLLDPTKGNVYQIKIQYLGMGPIVFEIEIPLADNNPRFVVVHAIEKANNTLLPTVSNPSFPFLMASYSAGSTTNLSVKSASFAGFTEGMKKLHGIRSSYVNAITTVGSANYQCLFTIKNKLVFAGRANQSVINLMSIMGAVKHTSPIIYYLIKNGVLSGNPNFQNHSTVSCSSYDTASTVVTFSTNDQLIWTGHLGDTGELDHHFDQTGFEEITLQPGEYITLAAKATTGTPSWVTGSINTREDQ